MQSKTDRCLFLRKDCILMVYVDDCLIFAEDNTMIDSLITELSKGFPLQDEWDVNTFLGVQITKNDKDKTITLTQPSLVQQILWGVGILDNSNNKHTPVDSILYADSSGRKLVDKWNYRSVLNKLNYLAKQHQTKHQYGSTSICMSLLES
jgi:hypothetical protein